MVWLSLFACMPYQLTTQNELVKLPQVFSLVFEIGSWSKRLRSVPPEQDLDCYEDVFQLKYNVYILHLV